VPNFSLADYVVTVVAVLGSTITSCCFFRAATDFASSASCHSRSHHWPAASAISTLSTMAQLRITREQKTWNVFVGI
jgi:hypothetical protein